MPTTTKLRFPNFACAERTNREIIATFAMGKARKKHLKQNLQWRHNIPHPPPPTICLSMQKSILNREAEKKIKSPFEHLICKRRCCLRNFVFPVSPPPSLLLRPEHGEHRWFSLSPSPPHLPPFLSGKFICAAKKSVPPFGNGTINLGRCHRDGTSPIFTKKKRKTQLSHT